MADRALAHVEKVVNVYGIEKADKVEMVQIMDYHVVAGKGDYKVGDLVVYVEVDSILPDGLPDALAVELKTVNKAIKSATGDELAKAITRKNEILAANTKPEFEFLRDSCKFRIKAKKYNSIGVISQGILFTTSILPEGVEVSEGLDVTAVLGITKVIEDLDEVNETVQETTDERSEFEKFLDSKFKRYKPYRNLKAKIKGTDRTGNWEEWMAPKTDEENIQKIHSKLYEEYGDEPVWAVTSKIEGQSMSAYNHIVKTWFGLKDRNDFAVCSHKRHLIRDDGSRFWVTARELDLQKRLKAIGQNIMIQGEHAGGKIQGNIYKLPEHHLYIFGIYDLNTRRKFGLEERLEFCHKYEFDHVPVVSHKMGLFKTVQEMLDFSNRKDCLVPGVEVLSEGLVWEHLFKPDHFKVKSPEYLIFHKK